MGVDCAAHARAGSPWPVARGGVPGAINAARYLVWSGCGWRLLPIHFGHWRTVYGWFRELAHRLLVQTIHDVELERAGRKASPTVAVIDSPSVKAPYAAVRRCDDVQGFEIRPRRWDVERTYGWMIR